jgi:WD40 repeat protein
LAVAPDGSWLASASADLTGGEVHVWDPVTGRRRATLDRHRHGVRALTVSRDGTILATGDGTDWGAGTVRIFETATFRPELTLDGHTNTIAAIVIAPDGSWIASGDTSMAGRGEVRIWTTDGVGQAHWDEPKRAGGDARAVRALAATTDGQRVLSLGRAARTAIRIWDPATGELDAVVRRDASDFGVFPDREWIALAENRDPDGGAGIVLWDLRAGRVIRHLPEPRGPESLLAAPDGSWIAAVSIAGSPRATRLTVWNATTGDRLFTRTGAATYGPCLTAPRNGSWLAAAVGSTRDAVGEIVIWDARTLTPRCVLPGSGDDVCALAASHDGSWLAAGYQDRGNEGSTTGMAGGAAGRGDGGARRLGGRHRGGRRRSGRLLPETA